MNTRTIPLSEFQQGELNHKLCILRDEQDLLDSYDVTEAEVQTLIDALPNGAGAFTFDPKYADMMAEEIDNSIDIIESNLGSVSDDELPQMRGLINSLRSLQRKLR